MRITKLNPNSPNRIAELRVSRGWTQAEYAEKVGTSPPQINRLEKGNVGLTLNWMKRLSKPFGLEPADLIANGNITPQKLKHKNDLIPVFIGANGSGTDAMLINLDSEPYEWITRPSVLDGIKKGIVLVVNGDSMAPRHRHGERVNVAVGQQPTKGNDCIIVLDNGEWHLKEFVGYSNKDIICLQHNPSQERTFPRKNIIAVHMVIRS